VGLVIALKDADTCTRRSVVSDALKTQYGESKAVGLQLIQPKLAKMVQKPPATSTMIDVSTINNGSCRFYLTYNAAQSGLTDDMYRWVIKFYDTNLIRPLDHDKAFGYMKLTYTKPVA